ncbi:MAG: DNA repair exonuclease [Candidatus Nitrosocaldaceae archaeon]
MLLAHISDTHLGATQYGKEERENDFYNAFKEAIDIIIKEHVELVIHAGDIFDMPRPSGTAIVKLLDELKRLEEHNIRFVFVLGEHDISRLRATPVPSLYDKIKLATHLGNKDNNTIKVKDLTIVGYRKHRLNEISNLKDNLSRLKIEGKKILVLHQGLKEFHEYANELTHTDLPNDFDYYAMGHLHNKGEKLFNEFKGPVCYPGSTEITRFAEDENIEKGFYLVDLSNNTNTTWIKLDIRQHISVNYDETKMEEIIEEIKKAHKKPIVKVLLKDPSKREIVRRLEEYALHVIPQYVRKGYTLSTNKERSNIHDEMMKCAEKILGSRDKANFAINELLETLLTNEDDALEILWNAYKNKRFG